MKNTLLFTYSTNFGTFANLKYEELSYGLLPQNSEHVRPHSSHSSNSIENAMPLWSNQSWKCDTIQRHISISLL